MNAAAARKLMTQCHQEHVLDGFSSLPKKTQDALLKQIGTLDAKSLAQCATALKTGGETFDSSKGRAPKVVTLKGAALKKAVARGEQELRAGRVAALLVAGGQGSRLGYDGPKGCFPIGPLTDAPLFYFHARKILARSRRYGKPIPFYVMTSEANNAATVACFEAHRYFGLDKKDVFFFTQGMWPGMTKEGKIILDAKGHIFMSPDGHGGLVAALKRSGALADMEKRGISSVFYFQVDNPLVEIADPAFIGFHVLEKSEYSLKLCAKRDPYEKVGMPMAFTVKGKTQHRLVEYSEMTPAQCERKTAAGDLYFKYGSPAIHVFDRAFLKREAEKAMPIHLAFKKIPTLVNGKVVKPTEPNGYKFEKFIFDILPNARRAAFLAFETTDEFSPVKNAEGADSPATCQRDMQAKWRGFFKAAGGVIPPAMPIEIDPAYALDAQDLLEKGVFL